MPPILVPARRHGESSRPCCRERAPRPPALARRGGEGIASFNFLWLLIPMWLAVVILLWSLVASVRVSLSSRTRMHFVVAGCEFLVVERITVLAYVVCRVSQSFLWICVTPSF